LQSITCDNSFLYEVITALAIVQTDFRLTVIAIMITHTMQQRPKEAILDVKDIEALLSD